MQPLMGMRASLLTMVWLFSAFCWSWCCWLSCACCSVSCTCTCQSRTGLVCKSRHAKQKEHLHTPLQAIKHICRGLLREAACNSSEPRFSHARSNFIPDSAFVTGASGFCPLYAHLEVVDLLLILVEVGIVAVRLALQLPHVCLQAAHLHST